MGNRFGLPGASANNKDESLELWHKYKVYFIHAVTTSQASRKMQVHVCPLGRKGGGHPQPLRILGFSVVRIVYGAQVKLYYMHGLELVSFADAESAENIVHNIFAAGLAGDFR